MSKRIIVMHADFSDEDLEAFKRVAEAVLSGAVLQFEEEEGEEEEAPPGSQARTRGKGRVPAKVLREWSHSEEAQSMGVTPVTSKGGRIPDAVILAYEAQARGI